MTVIPNSLEHLYLKFGYCLGFGICNLGFQRSKAHFETSRNRAQYGREAERATR